MWVYSVVHDRKSYEKFQTLFPHWISDESKYQLYISMNLFI